MSVKSLANSLPGEKLTFGQTAIIHMSTFAGTANLLSFGVKFASFQMPQHALTHAREIALHLPSCRKILRLLARRFDRIKDSLVAFIRRVFAIQFLQQPVGFKDAYVRQVPDNGAKTKTGTLAQILFARHVKERKRRGARPFHLFCYFFH